MLRPIGNCNMSQLALLPVQQYILWGTRWLHPIVFTVGVMVYLVVV